MLAAAALFSASYAADPLPKDTLAGCAVSAPNGKLGGAAGTANNVNGDTGRTDFAQLTGSYSVPLGCAFGLQADGSLTSSGGGTWGGVAAHLFYRDPAKYLLGASASYEAGHGTGQIFRIGPEVELYINNVNIEAWAGWASMAGGPSDWFAAVDAALYPTENLRLSAGWRHSFRTDVAVGRAELQVDDDKPVSVFAEGRVGAGGYSVVKGGVNVYFGDTGKTLLQRRRTGYPQNWLFDLLAAKANGSGSSSTGGGTCVDDRNCTTGEHCISGTCTPPTPVTEGYCGDGVPDEGEQCDEGPDNGHGACSEACTIRVVE
ncbi:MAG: hypothetical protein WDM94_13030 [Bauldia sp.]